MPKTIKTTELVKLCRLVRYDILHSTTEAGSGHPTTSLSAVELMVGLMFSGTFQFDANQPSYPNNDRLIFSKGHAAPLLYSLWHAAGKVSEQELLSLRKFGSRLEGHPTMSFPFTEAATGSLGQGLSVGVGMAMNAKYLDKLPYRTYVLLGDSEMAEGSVWEAAQIASHYKLDNLIAIVDVNRLGQRGETMLGYNVKAYEARLKSFGWQTIVIDGHSLQAVLNAYKKALKVKGKPVAIIAKTVKGKGIPYFENKDGWHGVPLKQEEFETVIKKFGKVDLTVRGTITAPKKVELKKEAVVEATKPLVFDKPTATRKAYGQALVRIASKYPNLVVLDAEVSNSTFAETFKKEYPKRFFEMYIAEQNMVGTALGLSRRGKIPFISTFAAFLTRAFDQIRMAAYSQANIKIVGSHAGVSIGQDGVSQMGLEDIAMMRSVFNSVVLYPCDAVSTDKLVEEMAKHKGIVYLRTTRADTPIIYQPETQFPIGGSKVLHQSGHDVITIISAGITIFEALAAQEVLSKQEISVRIIDLYSIKPIDEQTLIRAASETKAFVTVEDHYPEGGIGEAVRSVFSKSPVPIVSLAVRRIPKSGMPAELLSYEGISRQAIIEVTTRIIKKYNLR